MNDKKKDSQQRAIARELFKNAKRGRAKRRGISPPALPEAFSFRAKESNTGPALSFIVERKKPGSHPSCFMLYACRGEGKGCPRNKFRNSKKHCDDCVACPDDNMTVGQIQKMMERGDA